jgi:MFS family permease
MGTLRDLAVDLTPLRKSRQFRLLYAGTTLSAIGSRLTDLAVPFQIYALTHSTLALGLLGLVTLVPRLTLSIVGGALADRLDRRRMLLVAELAGGLFATLLLANALLDEPRLWVVYVAAFGLACAFSVAGPTGRSAIPLLLGADQYTSAMALKAIAGSVSWLLGPAIGGILYGIGGAGLAYAVDLGSFVVGAGFMMAMRPIPRAAETSEHSTFGSIAEGFRVLRKRQPVVGSFLMDLNAMVFGLPVALFPAIVDQRFDGRVGFAGLLTAAPFAGSLVASASSGWTKRVHRHGLAITVSVVGWGAAMAVFGLVSSLWASLLLLAVAGGADMVSGVFRQAMLALDTPPEMMGRMEGVGLAVWTTGPALGDIEAGVMASLTSVTTAVVTGGLACMGGAVALFALLPRFAHYDTRHSRSTEAERSLSVVVGGEGPAIG